MQGDGIAVVGLVRPDGFRPAEKAAGMIEQRVEIDLVQRGAYVAVCAQAEIGALRRGNGRHAILQGTLAHPIARAHRKLVTHKLVQKQGGGFFLKMQRLADARRHVQQQRAERIQRSHRPRAARFQNFSCEVKIRAGPQFLIEGQAKRFKPRAGNQPGHGFRQDAAESLIEPGNFRRLQAHAGIVEHASERARPDAAEGGVLRRGPAEARLRRNLVLGIFRAGQR